MTGSQVRSENVRRYILERVEQSPRLLLSQPGWGRLLLTRRFGAWLLVAWLLVLPSIGLIAFLSFVVILLTLGLVLLTVGALLVWRGVTGG